MKIFLVDDEEPVRKAIMRLLRAEGLSVAAFASAAEFLDGLDSRGAGCLVLDVAMPGLSGLELQEELARRGARLPIVFLTGRADVPMCALAMKRGAVDFLVKPVNDSDLLAAVRRALDQDERASRQHREQEEISARLQTLTAREREVLELVVRGKLNKQIAADLGAAEKTIKVHRGRVMTKMAAASVADLVRMMQKVRPDG
jgi:FixJ family two-component response regulator